MHFDLHGTNVLNKENLRCSLFSFLFILTKFTGHISKEIGSLMAVNLQSGYGFSHINIFALRNAKYL